MINPNQAKRPGRMLAALIASDNKKGRMELTVTVTDGDGGKALHRAFTIKKWTPQNGGTSRLFVALPDTADWGAGIKPVTPLSVNLETGEVKADLADPRVTPLLRYAAQQALQYARTGETGTPSNGKVEVVEAAICGHCGAKLTDDVSIALGMGKTCEKHVYGTATKRGKAIPVGQKTITEMAQAIGGAA